MRDCDNVSVRDRLPELLHGRLAEAERARVQAHVDACAECDTEWRVLRASRQAIDAMAPRVDADAIARAVTARLAADRGPALRVVRGSGDAAAAPRSAPVAPRRRSLWSSGPIRAAAAVVVMALGAGVVATRRTDQARVRLATAPVQIASGATSTGRRTESVAVTPPAAPAGTGTRSTAARTANAPTSALGATFSDLSDEELAAVIRAVDSDAGLPAADSSAAPALVTSGETL